MKSTVKTSDQAIDQFIGVLSECQEIVHDLQKALDNHFDVDPDNLNWSHVGDAQRLLEDLKAIREYVK